MTPDWFSDVKPKLKKWRETKTTAIVIDENMPENQTAWYRGYLAALRDIEALEGGKPEK